MFTASMSLGSPCRDDASFTANSIRDGAPFVLGRGIGASICRTSMPAEQAMRAIGGMIIVHFARIGCGSAPVVQSVITDDRLLSLIGNGSITLLESWRTGNPVRPRSRRTRTRTARRTHLAERKVEEA